MKVLRADRCQCCNTSLDIDAHNVFDEDGKTQNIAALLHDYIGKQLYESDGLNYAICDSCWQQLLQCHAFKQKCIQANAMAVDDNQSAMLPPIDDVDDDVATIVGYQLAEYTPDGMVIEYLDDTDLYDNKYDNIDGIEGTAISVPVDFASMLVNPSTCDKFSKLMPLKYFHFLSLSLYFFGN